jgi:hypothetical protein
MSLKTTNDILAGSAAGTAQVLASQPLDTIKTRAQIAPSACPTVYCAEYGAERHGRGHVCAYMCLWIYEFVLSGTCRKVH